MKETYLKLLRRICRLIISPTSEFVAIKEEKKPWKEVEREFLIPLWSLLVLSMGVRIVYLYFFKEYEFSKSTFSADLTDAIVVPLTIIVCFYLAVLVRSKAYGWYSKYAFYRIPLHIDRGMEFTSIYISYCTTLLVVTQMAEYFFPMFEMFYLPLNVYSAYIYWSCYWVLCHREKSMYNPQPFQFILMTLVLVYGYPFLISGIIKKVVEFALM